MTRAERQMELAVLAVGWRGRCWGADSGDAMEVGVGGGGKCRCPPCKPARPGALERWLDTACPGISLCVALDLASHLWCPLWSPHSQVSQQPQDNQLRSAAAGMQGVLLTMTKVEAVQPGRQEEGPMLRMALCPTPLSPQHIVAPEGKGHGPGSNRIRTQSRKSVLLFRGFWFSLPPPPDLPPGLQRPWG